MTSSLHALFITRYGLWEIYEEICSFFMKISSSLLKHQNRSFTKRFNLYFLTHFFQCIEMCRFYTSKSLSFLSQSFTKGLSFLPTVSINS